MVTQADRDAREREWLTKHSREFVGKWVALDGDRLLAAGEDGLDVYREGSKHSPVPTVFRVEAPDALPLLDGDSVKNKRAPEPGQLSLAEKRRKLHQAVEAFQANPEAPDADQQWKFIETLVFGVNYPDDLHPSATREK